MGRTIQFLVLMHMVNRFVRAVTPWIVRIISFMFFFVLTSVGTFWGEVPNRVDAIAYEWQQRALDADFPHEWDRTLYWIFYVLAFGMIILGWILLSDLTTKMIHLIFN